MHILEHLFKVLLSKFSDDCADAKNYLDEKPQSDIEKIKELKRTNSTTSNQLESEETEIEAIENEFPIREDVYLQQSKCSIYF